MNQFEPTNFTEIIGEYNGFIVGVYTMKKGGKLNAREEELLQYLWEVGEPLTVNEMIEKLEPKGWGNVTVFKTVQSLSNAGLLEIVGMEKSAKTYARRVVPAYTKEEYYALQFMKYGIESDSIADITAALIGASRKSKKERDEEVIAKLEEIIVKLKNNPDTER